MFRRIFTASILLVIATVTVAQTGNDTVNRIDKNGLKHGYWRKVNEKGMLKYTGQFDHGIPVGEFTYFYPDGITKARSEFSNNGRSTHTITYHHSGKVMSDGYYLDKKKDSLWSYYDNSGAILKVEFYRNNMKEGVWKTYYDNGQVAEEMTYKSDKKNGPWKTYYPDGTLKLEATHLNGERNGTAKYYYPSGKLELSGHYDSSMRIGEWFYYDEDGKLIKKEIYEKGKLVKTVKQDQEKQDVEKQ